MTPCPICRTPVDAQRLAHHYWYCRTCNFYFLDSNQQNPATPSESEYDVSYYARGMNGVFGLCHALLWKIDLIGISPYLKRGARALDVGCGAGSLVSYLRKRNLDAYGMDTSRDAIAIAKYAGVPEGNLYLGKLEELDIPTGFFDVATAFHVLEHVTAPAGFVRAVARVLKPGGRFIVRVPDISSLEARIGRSDWLLYDYPYHVAHYTSQALRKVLETNGFDQVQIRPNATQYRQVLLYSLLGAIGIRPRALWIKLCMLPLQLVFVPLSILWAVVFKNSGTIEAIATKGQDFASAPAGGSVRPAFHSGV